MITPVEIKSGLLARGVEVNEGLSDENLREWQSRAGFPIDPFWAALYREFDGFLDWYMDYGTAICVWPLHRILSYQESYNLPEGQFAFGDYMISSDMLLGDLRNAAAPVVFEIQDWEWAKSAPEFWEKFLAGSFDERE
jgi:hypothetical protein